MQFTIFGEMEESTNRVQNFKLAKSIITSHAVFNYLTVLQNHITLDQKRDAINGLASYARFSKQVLELADEDSALLTREKEVLLSYLTMEQQRFGSSFTFNISEEEGLEGLIPTMVLIPITELIITLSSKPIELQIRLGLERITWHTNAKQAPILSEAHLNSEQSKRRALLTQKLRSLLLCLTEEKVLQGTQYTLTLPQPL